MGRKRAGFESKFQSNKRAKWCLADDDLISGLPDHILIDILSLLPLEEAARTSVLSFRWLNLWQHTSRLDFNADNALQNSAMQCDLRAKERRKYTKLVNCVLRSHKAVTLKQFRIRFELNKPDGKPITKWLAYAFARKVERLEVDLCDGYSSRSLSYPFPDEILTRSIDFKSLKALTLKRVDVTAEAIGYFLRNCPELEQLIIHQSDLITNLEVCGSSLMLKYLEICFCFKLKSIKVSAPNLTSLKVRSTVELVLENVPMLIDISSSFDDELFVIELLPALSCCVSQLEILTLMLSTKPQESMEFPEMPKLKKLVIECGTPSDKSLIGVTSFIKAAPYLEEFVLKLSWYVQRSYTEMKNTISFRHQHIKVVQFLGYYGQGSDSELLRYFLENCDALEKVIIDCYAHSWELYQAKQQLEAEVPQHIELLTWYIQRSYREVKNTIRFRPQHIKVVKFCGYYGHDGDAELLRYFLKDCDTLEKEIIDICYSLNTLFLLDL